MAEREYTTDELLVSVMAQQINEGDIVVQGVSTPLVLAAFLLAKRRLPGLQFLYTSGCSVSAQGGRVLLCAIEELTVANSLMALSSPRFHGEFASCLKTKEFLRPAQVDGSGRTNNVAIGPYERPRVRLPGAVGIPDVTTFNPNLYLYAPRHDARTLVERVDFVSGVGTHVQALFTELGVFRYHQGRARLEQVHPGVSVEQIGARTGFSFETASTLTVTPAPSAEELRLLREEIDPLGVRRLELVGGRERLGLLRELVAAEKNLVEVRTARHAHATVRR